MVLAGGEWYLVAAGVMNTDKYSLEEFNRMGFAHEGYLYYNRGEWAAAAFLMDELQGIITSWENLVANLWLYTPDFVAEYNEKNRLAFTCGLRLQDIRTHPGVRIPRVSGVPGDFLKTWMHNENKGARMIS